MIFAMIQARMGSTRLPGKVLMDINGKSALNQMIERVKRAKLIDHIYVLTSTEAIDDAIERHLASNSFVKVFRGDEADVLKRYIQCVECYDLSQEDVIVRLTADCPLIDPEVIDEVVNSYINNECDYASNIEPPTFPDGMDCEVFPRKMLKILDDNAADDEREHVTLHIRNNADKYKIINYSADENYSDYRWTLDRQEDLDYIRKIFVAFDGIEFGYLEVINQIEEGVLPSFKQRRC